MGHEEDWIKEFPKSKLPESKPSISIAPELERNDVTAKEINKAVRVAYGRYRTMEQIEPLTEGSPITDPLCTAMRQSVVEHFLGMQPEAREYVYTGPSLKHFVRRSVVDYVRQLNKNPEVCIMHPDFERALLATTDVQEYMRLSTMDPLGTWTIFGAEIEKDLSLRPDQIILTRKPR